MTTLARSIASSASKLGVMPISINFCQRSLSTASLAPWLQETQDFGAVGEQRRALMKSDFVDAELLFEGRKNSDQRFADGAGADDVNDFFLCHGPLPAEFDRRILAQRHAAINRYLRTMSWFLAVNPLSVDNISVNGNNSPRRQDDDTVPAGNRFSIEISASAIRDLEKVIDAALGKKADYADLYFEYRRNEGVSLEEGMVKNCSQSTSNGVGVRVLADTKTGYAYTDDITIENLEIAARTAQLHRAKPRRPKCRRRLASALARPMISTRSKPRSTIFALDRKVALLYEIDKFTRALDPRVKNVFVSLGSRVQSDSGRLVAGFGGRRYSAADPSQRHLHRRGERQSPGR